MKKYLIFTVLSFLFLAFTGASLAGNINIAYGIFGSNGSVYCAAEITNMSNRPQKVAITCQVFSSLSTEPSEDTKTWSKIGSLKKVRAIFKPSGSPLLTPENVPQLSEEDMKNFLKFKKNLDLSSPRKYTHYELDPATKTVKKMTFKEPFWCKFKVTSTPKG